MSLVQRRRFLVVTGALEDTSKRQCVALLAVLLFGLLASTSHAAPSRIPSDIREILENADNFELLSIDPDIRGSTRNNLFHKWNVLGRIMVRDRSARIKLVTAFRRGVEENPGYAAACFNPRHGIRASYAGKSVDLVICFECAQVEAYSDGRERSGFLITASPEPEFDAILRSANVPLARDLKPAASIPGSQAPAASLLPSSSEPEALRKSAEALEKDGQIGSAIRLYRRAARAGSGKAALRLGEIFDQGLNGIPKDKAEALNWYQMARELGEEVPARR